MLVAMDVEKQNIIWNLVVVKCRYDSRVKLKY